MANEPIKVTVDTVALAVQQGKRELILIKRKHDPFKNLWALPGGFIGDDDETVEQAAARELLEETNVGDVYLEQLFTFGDKGRDPRGRVVTVSYLALLRQDDLEFKASSDASGSSCVSVAHVPIDYLSENVSEKIVRIIHSYTDYVSRVSWKKY